MTNRRSRKRRQQGAPATTTRPRPPVAPPRPAATAVVGAGARPRIVLAALLAAATLAALWPVVGNGFVNFDDPTYVTDNPHVRQGLGGIGWAWTATRAANWHPLTWISHMLDWQVHGAEPMGHHLTSLMLHLASVLLLFLALDRLTGSSGKSAFVAAAFAVHPLHVESVAWIAERKDVLSGLFWMLALLAYARYARSPRAFCLLLVALVLALGLAAKPMLVTLPFVLLLLDVWPLGRSSAAGKGAWRLVAEKIPLFALAAASCVATVVAQRAGATVAPFARYSLVERLSNAVVSYVGYLGKLFWPVDLAVYYPHPGSALPAWKVGGSALLLIAITVVALRLRRGRPYLLVGWLWYLGTLVPVIGLVQVGAQAMADRYTYLPAIGIFLAVAWGVPDAWQALRSRRPRPGTTAESGARAAAGSAGSAGAERTAMWIAAAVTVIVLAAGARVQTRYWKDSRTLFERALAVTENNFMAHNNLGIVLAESGQAPQAIEHYRAALRIRPDFANLHVNLGTALRGQGRGDEALVHFAEAVRLDRNLLEAQYNYGLVLGYQGRLDEAIAHYREALRIDPSHALTHNNLGNLLGQQGAVDEAIEHYHAAVRLKPDFGLAYSNLAGALVYQGRVAEARTAVEQARRFGYEPPAPVIQALWP